MSIAAMLEISESGKVVEGPELPEPPKRAPDPKPRAPRSRAKESTSKPAPDTVLMLPGGYAKPLQGIYDMVAVAAAPVLPNTAVAIAEHSETCAKSIEALAKENPAFRKVLNRFLTVSVVGVVIAAHAPIVMTAYAEISSKFDKDEETNSDDGEVGP